MVQALSELAPRYARRAFNALVFFCATRRSYCWVSKVVAMLMSRPAQICPHCAKPLQPIRYGVAVSPRADHIIDIIERAGALGIGAGELFKRVYGERGFGGANLGTLRSYIGALNRVLAPAGVAIRSDRCVYRIVRMRQCA